jgi:hypothetical protein
VPAQSAIGNPQSAIEQSAIRNRPSSNRQSAIEQSAIRNRQSSNPQSATRNPQCFAS